MAITCTINEFNGVGETEQANVTNLNMGNIDTYQLVPANYPVTITTNAFEKWVKMYFSGTVPTKVNNLKVWESSVNTLDANADLLSNIRESTYGGAETYTQPTISNSSVATQAVPETQPAGANLGIAGLLTGEILNASLPEYSDYCIFQYQTSAGHALGDIDQLTLTFQWDEQ